MSAQFKYFNQKGIVHTLPLLIVITAIGILSFLLLTSVAPFNNRKTSQLYPKKDSYAQVASLNRIPWQGKNWFIAGANVPWFNWGQDFGGGTGGGGVSGNTQALGAGFQQLKNAGVHSVRWWVFPGDPWQIQRDGSGPTGLNQAIYQDFDAAIALANQYDLYYNFVLFNSATAMPSSWLTNTTQRARLVTALTPLFTRYKNNPRVMSWEIYNEPEFQIWNGEISEAAAVDTATALTQAIHTNAPGTLVTVGNAFADGMPMWRNVGLDYYSPHWYDYMNSGNYCMRCNDYNYYNQQYNLNKPIVIGEFYGDSGQKWTDFYNKGYAGAWAWSIFYDHTGDRLQVNFPALTTFVSQHSDIGPSSTGGTPTPTFTPTATPTRTPTPTPTATPSPTMIPKSAYTISATTTPAVVSRGSNFTVSTSVKDAVAQTVLVDVEIYDPTGARTFQQAYDNQTFTANQTRVFTSNFTMATNAPTGNYRVQVGIFTPGWGTEFYWNDLGPDGTFSVIAGTPTSTPTPTPTPTATPTGQPTPIPGDIDGNRVVNIFDYNILVTNFGRTGSGIQGDIDNNNVVNIFDYNILVTNFGRTS